ncbi:MAG: hypothetical protein JXB47_18595 [Anaerolineae bacterium]|nr:hypothetical protein [Anaerolineae bacterium]
MTNRLRQILDAFEEAAGPMSLDALARKLEIEPALLESMISYWVHRGRIREIVDDAACAACGAGQTCPFIARLPRCYVLVDEQKH